MTLSEDSKQDSILDSFLLLQSAIQLLQAYASSDEME